MKVKYNPTKNEYLVHRAKARNRRIEIELIKLDNENMVDHNIYEGTGKTTTVPKQDYNFNFWFYLRELLP